MECVQHPWAADALQVTFCSSTACWTIFGGESATNVLEILLSHVDAHVPSAHDALRQTQQRLQPVQVLAVQRLDVVL